MIVRPDELMEAPKWKSRDELPHILNELGLLGHGVEIGVQRAVFGSHVRSLWNGEMYHGVDIWRPYYGVRDVQSQHDSYKADAIEHLEATGKPYKLWIETSAQFAARPHLIPCDWIYIDGDHTYDAVKAEIEAFWPLLKPGGIFAAHDWIIDGFHKNGEPFVSYLTEAGAGTVGHCGDFQVRRAFSECFPMDFASITSPDTDMGWQSIMFRKAR